MATSLSGFLTHAEAGSGGEASVGAPKSDPRGSRFSRRFTGSTSMPVDSRAGTPSSGLTPSSR